MSVMMKVLIPVEAGNKGNQSPEVITTLLKACAGIEAQDKDGGTATTCGRTRTRSIQWR